jgi:hypothetical protein
MWSRVGIRAISANRVKKLVGTSILRFGCMVFPRGFIKIRQRFQAQPV